jgi:hypothetical protein
MNVYNGVLKTMIIRLSSLDGSTANANTVLGTKGGTMKMNGKNGKLTFSGTGTLPIYNVHGQKIVNNAVSNVNYYLNGILYAKCKSTILYSYKMHNGEYRDVKHVDTTSTL